MPTRTITMKNWTADSENRKWCVFLTLYWSTVDRKELIMPIFKQWYVLFQLLFVFNWLKNVPSCTWSVSVGMSCLNLFKTRFLTAFPLYRLHHFKMEKKDTGIIFIFLFCPFWNKEFWSLFCVCVCVLDLLVLDLFLFSVLQKCSFLM